MLVAVLRRPDGRIDIEVSVPKEPMSWVVGAYSVSRETGLGIIKEPIRVKINRGQRSNTCSLGVYCCGYFRVSFISLLL